MTTSFRSPQSAIRSRRDRAANCRRDKRATLHFEQLENRELLAAQPVLPEWLITSDAPGADIIASAAVHPSGDVVVTAYFSDTVDFDPGPGKAELTSVGSNDVAIARYTPAGELVWARRLGGGLDSDRGKSIAIDRDGNAYVVAEFSGASGPIEIGGVQYPADYSDAFLSKLDGAGNLLWTRHFALNNNNWTDSLSGVSVDDRDPNPANWSLFVNGSFVGTGQFGTQTFTNHSRDVFVSKLLAADGNFVWTQIIDRASNEFSTAITLAKTNDAALYLLGEYETVVKSKGSTVVTWNNLLTKMDPATGATIWSHRIALGAGDGNYASGRGALAANGTHVYVGASFSGTNVDFDPGPGVYGLTSGGSRDAAILSLDRDGNFAWAWRRGGAGDDTLFGIAVSESGNVYATGRIDTNLSTRFGFLEQFDAAGGSVATYDFPGIGNAIAVDPTDNVYVSAPNNMPRIDLYPTGDRAGTVGSVQEMDFGLLKFSPSGAAINQTPSIESVFSSAKSVLAGESLTIGVNRVRDPELRFQTINFYQDSNANGLLEPGVDALLGSDSISNDGWRLLVPTAGLPTGDYTYFAEGLDGAGVVLDVAAVSVHVTGVEVVSYASTAVPKQIKDRTTITSTITVPDSFTVLDIDVALNITHTSTGELTAFLIGPDGTRVQLFARLGGSGDNFTGTVLDDEAAKSITSSLAPFTGRFKPQGSLSAFDGKNAAGTWTLEITDHFRQNTGTLNSWSLHLSRAVTPAVLTATSIETESPSTDSAGSSRLFDASAVDQLLAAPQSTWKSNSRIKLPA